MSRLTDIDLDPEAFGYMQVRQGTIAGVDNCIVWRIGFTGELSYELHVPAGFGLHVWEQLLDKGPISVSERSASRPSESCGSRRATSSSARTPTASQGPDDRHAALIKLDKDDFVGKPELAWSMEQDLPVLVSVR